MIKRTIIHLLLRILLVPAVPFFTMLYILHKVENDRHGMMKYMFAMFVIVSFTILYLIIESIVFFIRKKYESFRLDIILLIIIILLLTIEPFRDNLYLYMYMYIYKSFNWFIF